MDSGRRSPAPQRWPNRYCHPLPVDALIDLVIRCRLVCLVPARRWLDTLVIPQRRPACWCDARWLCIHPYVLQYLLDVGVVRDEGDDSHLPSTKWAQQREHLVDASNQHRPQAVRGALGWQRLGLGWEWIACVKCALAHTRADWLGTHLLRLRRCVLCQCHRRCPVRRVRCHRRCAARTQTLSARVIAR